ncbi:MAG: altronate dehydratase family protein [Synergistaceae bacterium]|nr:altronate dehydratase family protein [Synergistaceae bacterium]
MRSRDAIRLNAADNAVILPHGGDAGDTAAGISLLNDVPPGHKIAAAPISEGQAIVKYGRRIGEASSDIHPGEWIHEHNMRTRLGAGDELPEWNASVWADAETKPAEERKFFTGYRREGGPPGVRNDLWIIPTVGCINGELRSVISRYRVPDWITSVKVLEHPYGCSQLGDDLTMTRRILTGLAANPNAAGVLLVGLGCENLELRGLEEGVRKRMHPSRFRSLTLQSSSADDIVRLLGELAESAPRERVRYDASELCVGVKCGGSDGYSGLSANPLAGRFADRLASWGGALLCTEIPEMFGAEDEIVERIHDKSVYDSFIALDMWFRDYFRRHGQPIYENPSPGNRAGGITTLEEKSLGAVEKIGSSPITAILEYGEPRRGGGVQITFGPGNDPVSCTALAGSGAQIILFTTGRGTPFGSVVPTMKISTNSGLAKRHLDWIDFDAGALLDGESWSEATERLTDCVLRVASGERTKNESKNVAEIAIFKDGVTL